MAKVKKLIRNRWQTPDGTILESKHRHDFVSHKDANGEYYFIDGGTDYIRMTVNKEPMINLCEYEEVEELDENETEFLS